MSSVADPFQTGAVSSDGSTAIVTVTYDVQAAELSEADQHDLFAVGDQATAAGLTVNYSGDAAQEKVGESPAEAIGLAVAALVLLLTFGSMLAAGLPLVTAVVGVGLGSMGVLIASGFTDISSSTGTLALMLGLAVGIDYALFIVSRYRHELAAGHRGAEAAGRAVGTAGTAVVFAGATVVIALAALVVVGIPFLAAMGLAAAGTVLVSVLIALTLLPALLGVVGGRIRGRGDDDSVADARPKGGERWGRFVVRRRVPLLIAAVAGLGILAIPATDLRLGMPSDATADPGTTQRAAYDAISDSFGPGTNGPFVIVADLTGAGDPARAVEQIQGDLAATAGVASVTPGQLNEAGDTAVYQLVPTTGPDDAATVELVHHLRDLASGWDEATGASVYVTGTTAVNIDVSDQLSVRAAPLPARGGRPRAGAAAPGVPQHPGAAQGHRRLPAQPVRHLRRGGGRVPVGLVRGPARHPDDRPGAELPADPAGRASCSASPWTTRSSSSPGCGRPTCTAPTPTRPWSTGSGTARGSWWRQRSSWRASSPASCSPPRRS